jgi:tripartite-type tricarboxylate transporter receptor subunit TctC
MTCHSLVRRVAPCGVMILPVLAALASAARADNQDFYAGKTITMSTHTAPGGGYDSLLRTIAQFLGDHIPGRPKVVVVNMPGAGGLTAFNYVARIAPQDGTYLTLVGQGLVVQEPTGGVGMRASLGDMKWLGNVSQAPNVTVVWRSSKVKTLDDAKRIEATLGSTGAGSPDSEIPSVYNKLLGTKFRVIYGYEGGAQINLAMQRGEIDGRGTNTWPSYEATFPDAVRDHDLVPLIQIGLRKDRALPDVPLFADVVRGDASKESVAEFLSLTTAISRPLAAPPGTPDARVDLLRKAFDATMKDPGFLAAARRLKLDIDPMSGAETHAAIKKTLLTPKDVVAATKTALGGGPTP